MKTMLKTGLAAISILAVSAAALPAQALPGGARPATSAAVTSTGSQDGLVHQVRDGRRTALGIGLGIGVLGGVLLSQRHHDRHYGYYAPRTRYYYADPYYDRRYYRQRHYRYGNRHYFGYDEGHGH